jgi:acetylornithine deacetylase/succinyl-diaminopimelate desuccinylase-like protein
MDIPVVLMGFGLPEENVHAPNEYFDLDNFDRGLRTLALYWEKLGSL